MVGATLFKAVFAKCVTGKIDFSKANMERFMVIKTPLNGAIFKETNLSNAIFTGTDLDKVAFPGCTLMLTIFALGLPAGS